MNSERFYFEESFEKKDAKILDKNIKCDFLIIGGGITGLSIAYFLSKKRKNVVVVDKGYIGEYASGRSSGFLTQNTELDLYQIENKYGAKEAKNLWNSLKEGINLIKDIIKEDKIDCNYEIQPSLYLAIKPSHIKILEKENIVREKLSSKSNLIPKKELKNYIGSNAFYGGLLSKEDYSINAFKYISGLRNYLLRKNVKIYEYTEALKINKNIVKTKYAEIEAKQIILSVDHFAKSLGYFKNEIISLKTFVGITERLPHDLVDDLFRKGKMLLWDTKKEYNYWRLLPDNRILIGGGSNLEIVDNSKEETYESKPYEDLYKDLIYFYPKLKNINFEYVYHGVMGMTLDFLPIVGKINNKDKLSFCLCSAGLPLSTFSAKYLVDKLLNNRKDFDKFFNPNREFSKVIYLESLFGEKIFDYFSGLYLKLLNRFR